MLTKSDPHRGDQLDRPFAGGLVPCNSKFSTTLISRAIWVGAKEVCYNYRAISR
jgi:hypothetical protein